MKHIYKREPLQRSLPSNYNKLDAINYLNLSGFKGLQVYDNPLIAEQQSTYSCKNVYVDEHGNLTLRPALMPVSDIHCCWQHVFSDGTTVYAVSASNGYELQVGDASIEVPNLNNIALESNDRKYLFTQQGNNVLYDITDGQFTQVTGVTLLDDPKATDISHYNILNDKVLYEYAELPSNRTDENYDIIAQIDVETDGEIYPINTSTVLFISNSTVYWFERIHSIWEKHTIDLSSIEALPAWTLYPDKYQDEYTYTDFYYDTSTKRFVNLNSDGTITVVECTATQADAGIRDIFGVCTVYCRKYTIAKTGTLTNIVKMSKVYSGLTTVAPYADGFVALRYTDVDVGDGYPKLSLIHHDLSKEIIIVDEVYQPAHPEYYPIYYHLCCDTSNIYFLEFLTHRGVYRKQSWTLTGISNNDSKDVSTSAIGFLAASGPTAAMLEVCPYGNGAELALSDVWHESFRNLRVPNYYSYHTHMYLTTARNSISLSAESKSDNLYTAYELYDGTLLTYTPSHKIVNIFDGCITFETDNILTYRDKRLQHKLLTRSTSIIPVLSDINEKVVTGFFLDNCWWFITEHSIFGTGVDGNGLHTVERFDPLKYFKVSERITGAIRVSDTSFWVFHSQGAYLIYKTALTLSNGTEYRWLYTATAKSKGCDFENGLFTLPVSNNVVTVTSADICAVTMKENIQSDERSLVPITTQASALVREALQQTDSIKIFNHQYTTVFCLNPTVKTGCVPALVYSNTTSSWWYWEFPVNQIYSIRETEDYAILYCDVNGQMQALRLTADEYYYSLGILQYEIYADRVTDDVTQFVQIEWHWQSAVQLFTTLERRKQLLFTTFIFDDYAPDTTAEQTIEIGYHFDIYSREYATSVPDASTIPVYRVTNAPCRTSIGSYNYLQLNIYNREFDSTNFEVLTKPKVCCISMKYRILRGEI